MIGVLMDFTVPATPAPTITPGQNTLLINWGSINGGPSGILGYLVEYRKADSPIWYNAKTHARVDSGALAAASAAKTRGAVRRAAVLGAADVVSGVSYQVTDLPTGTLFFRMRAVSGAGVAGEPTAPVKVQIGALPPDGITGAGNYPNPFDSRKTQTTLVYAMRQNADVTIKIFNVFGGLVRELSYSAGTAGSQSGTNEVKWDGADQSGQKVSKGIYLAIIQSGGAKATLKIGVIH